MLDGKVTYEAVAEAHGLDVHAARRRARAGRLSYSAAGFGGFFFDVASGKSLITPYVTPAASAITPQMKNATPRRPSAVVTGLG